MNNYKKYLIGLMCGAIIGVAVAVLAYIFMIS